MKSANWTTFILGLWLVASAFAVSHAHTPAMTEEMILGSFIVGLSFTAGLISRPGRAMTVLSALLAACGLWTVVAPFVLDYTQRMTTSATNDVVVGGIVLILGLANTIPYQSRTMV
jgi:predicted ATP-grasp superfamily ATP-dependent carboligase